MKLIYSLLVILGLISCQQTSSKKGAVTTEKQALIESEINHVEETKTVETKLDTLIKTSESFVLNDIKCYWKLTILVYQEAAFGDGILELINLKNSKIIVSNSDIFSFDDSYYTHSFNSIDFESLNLDYIKDINFDGFQDVLFFDKSASGSAGMFYRAYVFNPEKKQFDYSETLSGYELTLDKTAKTTSFYAKNGMGWNISNVIHFDNRGKIQFTEETIREIISVDTTRFLITKYSKIKNKKVLETTVDTTEFFGY
uniref:XAC2610-related protein n=1 Tax=Flavobacterium sp. TaxID=239 RepID=UPI004049EFEE